MLEFLEYLLISLTARKYGASKIGVTGGIIGGVLGGIPRGDSGVGQRGLLLSSWCGRDGTHWSRTRGVVQSQRVQRRWITAARNDQTSGETVPGRTAPFADDKRQSLL